MVAIGKKNIRFLSTLAVARVIFLLLAGGLAISASAGAARQDGIAAIVNDRIITRSEVMDYVALSKQRPLSRQVDEQTLYQQALEELIDLTFQLSLADAAGINITDGEVQEEIQRIAQADNTTPAELETKMQGSGMGTLQEQVRRSRRLHKLRFSLISEERLQVNKAEILAVAKSLAETRRTYRLADMLIAIPDGTAVERIARLKQVVGELLAVTRSGEDFNKLADKLKKELRKNEMVTISNEPVLKHLYELPEVFQASLSKKLRSGGNLQIGEFIGPIMAPNGLHVLKLEEMQGERISNDEAKFVAIWNKAGDRLRELRKKAYVKKL